MPDPDKIIRLLNLNGELDELSTHPCPHLKLGKKYLLRVSHAIALKVYFLLIMIRGLIHDLMQD